MTPLAAFTFNALWSGAGTGTPCDTSNSGDPTVVYDPLADRWIVADFAWTTFRTGRTTSASPSPRRATPVTGGWWLYAIRADDAAHPWLPDYPKMGIWPDGLYMTANMFDCLTRIARALTTGSARLCFQSRRPRVRRSLRHVVVDLDSTASSACCPATCAEPPRRRPGEPARVRIRLALRLRGVEVPRRLRRTRIDLHRTDEREPDAYTGGRPDVPSPGNNLDASKSG